MGEYPSDHRLTFSSDQKLLNKYGLKANDAILADPEKHMGLYEDLIQNYNAVLIAGGAAQNTARGAQVRHDLPLHNSFSPPRVL